MTELLTVFVYSDKFRQNQLDSEAVMLNVPINPFFYCLLQMKAMKALSCWFVVVNSTCLPSDFSLKTAAMGTMAKKRALRVKSNFKVTSGAKGKKDDLPLS